MTRRDLLKILLASAVADALDVERLLWVPRPIVTVPAMLDPTKIRFAMRDHEFMADLGAVFVDTLEHALYLNTGTRSHPTWTLLRTQGADRLRRAQEISPAVRLTFPTEQRIAGLPALRARDALRQSATT